MAAPLPCEPPSVEKMTRIITDTLGWAIRKAQVPAIQSLEVVDGKVWVVETFSGIRYVVTVEELPDA